MTLIPRGWEGRNIPSGTAIRADALVSLEKAHPGAPQVADPARFLGANAEWLAFHTTLGHDGWEHPAEDVAHALQVSPRS